MRETVREMLARWVGVPPTLSIFTPPRRATATLFSTLVPPPLSKSSPH